VEQDAASEEQVGDLEPFDRGDIRGLRFGAIGTLNFERPWIYTFFAATSSFDQGFDADEDDSLILYDYRLDIPLGAEGTLSIGKQKEPFSMDRILGMLFDPLQERAAISDGMMPTRNVGVVFNSTLAGERITYAGGVFNDWFDAGEEFDESATQVIGRITGLPFMSVDEASLLHLGFGLRYSNAKAGVRYRVPPEFHFSPDFVDTGTGMDGGSFEADSTMTYDFELSARRGPFWVHSEFLVNSVAAPAVGDPVFGGYHVTGSWVVTGEMRGYNKRSGIFDRIHVARPVTQGGSGAWELGARWSSFDLTDGAIEGGDMQILSFGATWWATDVANASVNFRNVNLDRFGLRGNSKGVTARVVLFLQ
jgi:phosphate-selective porin OprO/OprP